jgi:hypothetical protein
MPQLLCKENDNIYKINIKFDTYGNIYLDTSNTTLSLKYNLHQLNIDNKGDIYVESYNYQECDKSVKFVGDISILKKHIIQELDYLEKITEGDVIESGEYIIEQEDSEDIVIDEDIVKKYGHCNYKFDFNSSGKENIDIVQYENEEVSALYDTYIYIDDDLIYSSTSKISDSIYKIIIRNDNIYIRQIGYKEKGYNILINNGLIEFVLI